MPLEQLYMWFSVMLLAVAVGIALRAIGAERRTRLNEADARIVAQAYQTYLVVDVGDGVWHWRLADICDGTVAPPTYDHPYQARIIRTLDRQDTAP